MPVQVYCPHCNTPCQVADQHIGKLVKCHKCAEHFLVERVAAAPPAKSAAPLPEWMSGGGSKSPPAPAPPKPVSRVQAPAVRLDIGCATSAGRVRNRNEDSLLVKHQKWCNADQAHEMALLVVADGMGGHEGGDQASGLVIRTVGAALSPLLDGALSGQFSDPAAPVLADLLNNALQEANRIVSRKGKSDPGCKGMGSTAAVVLIWNGQVLILHVGDCRVYHYREERLTQVTRDQTLVARMVELGKLTAREALTHPARNEVTQAVGKGADLEAGRYKLQLAPGDWLIVACDGLHAHVDGPTLEATLTESASSAAHVARQLVDMANRGGGSDNCTVIAVYCE